MSSIRIPVKTIVIASGTPSGANSGPSYTFSREYTFITQDGNLPVYNDLTPIAFFENKTNASFNYNVDNTRYINLFTGGVAFLCPTTLSKITGSINFGFAETNANDISLNIYKTSITNAYTDFSTGPPTLLSSSRFVYNTPGSAANITVPVNVTSAGLTNNDIVYVAFEMRRGSRDNSLRFTMRYTLNFS